MSLANPPRSACPLVHHPSVDKVDNKAMHCSGEPPGRDFVPPPGGSPCRRVVVVTASGQVVDNGPTTSRRWPAAKSRGHMSDLTFEERIARWRESLPLVVWGTELFKLPCLTIAQYEALRALQLEPPPPEEIEALLQAIREIVRRQGLPAVPTIASDAPIAQHSGICPLCSKFIAKGRSRVFPLYPPMRPLATAIGGREGGAAWVSADDGGPYYADGHKPSLKPRSWAHARCATRLARNVKQTDPKESDE